MEHAFKQYKPQTLQDEIRAIDLADRLGERVALAVYDTSPAELAEWRQRHRPQATSLRLYHRRPPAVRGVMVHLPGIGPASSKKYTKAEILAGYAAYVRVTGCRQARYRAAARVMGCCPETVGTMYRRARQRAALAQQEGRGNQEAA